MSQLPPHVCPPTLALLPRSLIPLVRHALCGHPALQALCTQDTPTLLEHLPNSLGSPVPWRVVSWDPPYVDTAVGLVPMGQVPTLLNHLISLSLPESWRVASCLAAVNRLWPGQTSELVHHPVGCSEV